MCFGQSIPMKHEHGSAECKSMNDLSKVSQQKVITTALFIPGTGIPEHMRQHKYAWGGSG